MAVTSRFEISKKTHQASYHMHSAHAHSYYEMFYLISGGCDLFIKNNVYHLTPAILHLFPQIRCTALLTQMLPCMNVYRLNLHRVI